MTEKTFAEILDEATDRSRDMDAPLGERLKAVADEVRRVSPEFAATVDRMVARLAASNVGQTAPKPGESMPDFVLPDEGGRLVRLTDLLDNGPVVLSFNRGHWCPYCRLNVAGLAEIAPEVESLGARIVAISPEKARYGKELKSYAKAPFPVLADIDNAYALELNLLFWVGDEKREAMQAGGYDIAPYQGQRRLDAADPRHFRRRPRRRRAGRATSIPTTDGAWTSTNLLAALRAFIEPTR